MPQSSFVMFDEEYREITAVIEKLLREANAKCVYLVDKDGQLIASSGATKDIDATSLASLTAGNIAATGGLAKLIGEKEFSILFHEGEKDNLHISVVEQRVILVVIFDKSSSLGLVRLRVRKASEELGKSIQKLMARMAGGAEKESLLEEISDEDIERLFH
ncbi:MAG TPA: dynein regulation protein LC7 [Deltaproteobacteria bacterium]|nr:MAG: dynein regulation protein LC7 [Deltaproteobacteria bacterium GWA2_55_82]OGQ65001.1 MAG: dynein regulation protein LC7 [Deltaproteobacteria bacterium RIFCSPLOWO2_02_FULL_55_12]OIJ73814.1 MAG: dynein regulation protein LC7 [Deltaproteobacteria bacterium GWC2_55_46]HBG45780.1 dynein regulation protein LC7 [Deltaproteobacteria bacterium]HCY09801.1 dynein regulation protein LC7 [Deltaproteobacteria bacterium]